MKTIIIVRHAKSSWDNPMLKDVDRPLNARGKKDAPFMAQQLVDQGIRPQLLISSHAVRARQTAEAFASTFGFEKEAIMLDKSLYHGDIEEFINATLLLSDDLDVVMLFGHNPGITYFANVICEANIENVPTCGVLVITSTSTHWAQTDISDLRLTQFIYPKQYA